MRTASPHRARTAALVGAACPPEEFDAYWIERSGRVEPVELDVVAPRPLLLPGSDGSPWLIVDTEA